MNGLFTIRGRGLEAERGSDGSSIRYVIVDYRGEGPFGGQAFPVAIESDGDRAAPGPPARQVAERLVRQANAGLPGLSVEELPATALEFFFVALNRRMVPRDLSVAHPLQARLEALLAAEDLLRR